MAVGEPNVQPLTDEQREQVERLIDINFETDFSGFKSSEGDGRTAADIERERETHGAE